VTGACFSLGDLDASSGDTSAVCGDINPSFGITHLLKRPSGAASQTEVSAGLADSEFGSSEHIHGPLGHTSSLVPRPFMAPGHADADLSAARMCPDSLHPSSSLALENEQVGTDGNAETAYYGF
jgi:hypothetical protein